MYKIDDLPPIGLNAGKSSPGTVDQALTLSPDMSPCCTVDKSSFLRAPSGFKVGLLEFFGTTVQRCKHSVIIAVVLGLQRIVVISTVYGVSTSIRNTSQCNRARSRKVVPMCAGNPIPTATVPRPGWYKGLTE
jgi:hypothetical protein